MDKPIDIEFWAGDRLWSRVDTQGPDDCWEWQSYTNQDGYGKAYGGGGSGAGKVFVHRVAYTLTHGPIPEGLTVDHTCHNRPCCNPAHLRLLPPEINASLNAQSRRTHCIHGHQNWQDVGDTGRRRCVTCRELVKSRREPGRRQKVSA